MAVRVPLLLQRVAAVVHRLDIAATEAFDVPGPAVSGYDRDFQEPIVFTTGGGARESARQELPAVRIPCQTESLKFEELRQLFSGDVPSFNMILVFHRKNLEDLSLIDPTTRDPLVRVNDRVSALEKLNAPGSIVQSFTGEDRKRVV